MGNKLSYEAVVARFANKGYVALFTEEERKNSRIRLPLRCPNGHNCQISLSNFNQGGRCRCQARESFREKKQIGIENIRTFALGDGYILLSSIYESRHAKLQFRCPNGHDCWISWNSFQKGTRCPIERQEKTKQFNKQRRLNFEDIKQGIEKEGYIVHATKEDYKNNLSKLHLTCPSGHDCWICWNAFKFGQVRCKKDFSCKRSFDYIQSYVESQGYKINSSEYEDSHSNLSFTCPKGHVYEGTWTNFQQGCRCPMDTARVSDPEMQIGSIYNDLSILKNRRSIIPPYEIDLYFPDCKVAIEYCGLYWHSDAAPGDRIDSNYHRAKIDLCIEKGIRLLTIFEDEWLQHKNICISRIDNALGITKNKIPARKCLVKEITNKEASKFLSQTHLQGSGKCKISFGLFYNNNLMQVMTFGALTRAHTSKGKKVLEMKRLAGELNTVIVGGAAKIFKLGLQYAKDNGYDLIKSYCDLRWGTGNLYKKLGFELISETKYTPHYTDGIKRWRNQTLATNKRLEQISETNKAFSKGLWKIYDCGHQTWEYNV
jgi:hypothetical protein